MPNAFPHVFPLVLLGHAWRPPWRDLAAATGILEPIAEDDPDEGVKARAAQAIKAISA